MGNVRPFLRAMLLLQIFSTDLCNEPTWSCYKETGSCYYVSTVPTPRTEASCWCRSAGGHLVKFDSFDELRLIRQLLANTSHPTTYGFFIGATDIRTERQFLWDDGTDAERYLPWWEDPASVGDHEHCVIMHNTFWKDFNPPTLPVYMSFTTGCLYGHYFVCERDLAYSHVFEIVSRDETYPLASLESFSKVSRVQCADMCIRTCLCMSFGHRVGQNGGDCILYRKYYSRLTASPQYSPGFAMFE